MRAIASVTCLKGMKLIAGGNAPGMRRFQSDPERVAFSTVHISQPSSFARCDAFRVGDLYGFPGGVAPGYWLRPFQGQGELVLTVSPTNDGHP